MNDSANNSVPVSLKEEILNYFSSNGELTNLSYGAILVLMEMSLTFLSIVLNLVVLISIREKENLLNSTLNIVLANLCFSNLMTAVFVKSIAIIYNGYAVASGKWSVELAFCTIHAISSRATWAVLPYSIVVLCWLFVVQRASGIFGSDTPSLLEEKSTMEEVEKKQQDVDYEKEIEGLEKIEGVDEENDIGSGGIEGFTSSQKCVLGFIWIISAIYSFLTPQIFDKSSNSCALRDELNTNLSLISLFIMIPIPLFIGPVLCTFAQILLTFCACFFQSKCFSSFIKNHGGLSTHTQHHSQYTNKATYVLLFLLTLVFALGYPVNMFFVERYLGTRDTIFAFMALKYVFGYLHMVLIPIFIILTRRDILKAANSVLSKTSIATLHEDEITYEQFQTHCGMGVNPT